MATQVHFMAAFLILMCFMAQCVLAQKPPKEYAKEKCEKRIQNETLLNNCKKCIDDYILPENSTRIEIRTMIRTCVPKKDPKEYVKGKCDDSSDQQEMIEACQICVDNFPLPENVTRDDVRDMKRNCLPKPSVKFQAKRKCMKKLRTQNEIDMCQSCVQNYNLPERASCEEVKEMKRHCITERSGREVWTEPLMKEEDDDDDDDD